MLKKIVFVIILSTSLGYAQIVVKDHQSKAPISYATVSFGNGNGLFADDEGMFIFSKKLYPDIDSLYISALGYRMLKTSTENLPNVLELIPSVNELDEVIISTPIDRKFKLLRYKPFLDNAYEKCWLPTIESEIAVYIPKEDPRDQQITKIQFPIALETRDWEQRNRKNAEKKSFSTLFLVKLYDNIEGLPGQVIIDETIVLLVTEKTGDFFEVNLEELNIMLPDNGAFASIQVLGYADKSGKLLPNKKYKEIKGRNGMVKIPTNFRPLLPFTDELGDYRTFTRRVFINGNDWKAFIPNYGIESRLLDKGYTNYGIGVTLKAFKDE